MKKKTKTKRKTYETIFSFKIQGTPVSTIVPPPAIVPPVPPLLPFPPNPESPFTPGGSSPLNPLPATPPVYYQPKQWTKVIHRYVRDYGWRGSNYNSDVTYGVDGMNRYNLFKSQMQSTGHPYPSASHPGDMIVEETELGYYPSAEFASQTGSRTALVVVWNVYFHVEYVNYGETGIEDPWSLPEMNAGAALWFPFIARYEVWSLFLSSDPADSFWG